MPPGTEVDLPDTSFGAGFDNWHKIRAEPDNREINQHHHHHHRISENEITAALFQQSYTETRNKPKSNVGGINALPQSHTQDFLPPSW